MTLLFDSFWRAAAYCLLPRVILLSLLPFVVMAALVFGLGWFFYDDALIAIESQLASWEVVTTIKGWMQSAGLGHLRSALPPLVLVLISTPLIIVLSLLVVVAVMAPAIVNLVARRRFPALDRLKGGSLAGSIWSAFWTTLLALCALVLSIPLWLIPPLMLILPPLIWGWLTYKLMSYDALAEHASRAERRELIRRHRLTLFAMGIVAGYLGTAPSLVWVSGLGMLLLAPILIPVAIWIYMLVFAFSALWFSHYLLSALAELRGAGDAATARALPEPAAIAGDGPVLLPPPRSE